MYCRVWRCVQVQYIVPSIYKLPVGRSITRTQVIPVLYWLKYWYIPYNNTGTFNKYRYHTCIAIELYRTCTVLLVVYKYRKVTVLVPVLVDGIQVQIGEAGYTVTMYRYMYGCLSPIRSTMVSIPMQKVRVMNTENKKAHSHTVLVPVLYRYSVRYKYLY